MANTDGSPAHSVHTFNGAPASGVPLFVALTIALACFAAAILYASLPWGIGVSPDSVAYMKAAGKLAEGFEYTHIPRYWPPGYPLYLTAIMLVVPEMTQAALYGQLLLFPVNTALVALVVWRAAGVDTLAARITALVSALLFAIHPAVLLVHQYALSEALFVFFLLAGLLACLNLSEHSGKAAFFFAALTVSGLPFVRFAGMAFMPFFAAYVYFMVHAKSEQPASRLRSALAFFLISITPFCLYIALNLVFWGEPTNREFAYHPINATHWSALWQVVREWFLSPGPDHISLVPMACAALLVMLLIASRQAPVARRVLVAGLALALIGYIAFLLVSISLVDAHVPLDRRILVPGFVLMIITSALAAHAVSSDRRFWPVIGLPLALLLAGFASNAAVHVSQTQAFGLGYNSRFAAESALLKLAAERSEGTRVYTNAGDYLFLHTGLESRALPKLYNVHTLERNDEFVVQMSKVVEEVDTGVAVVVWFSGFDYRQYYPAPALLEGQFGLRSEDGLDGRLYDRFSRRD